MNITYLSHSGFCIELTNTVLIFDFYQGELPKLSGDKKVYVFASHKHYDHFNLNIFRLAERFMDITFVLSKDCRVNTKYLERKGIDTGVLERIVYVKKYEKLQLESIQIETLASTDAGVAFMVQAEGRSFYHAGDLNWWTWEGEETKEEYEDMTKRFQREIASIKGRHFDVAFLPLDGRQGSRYGWGFRYFAENVEADWLVPMHFWGDFSVVDRLLEDVSGSFYREKIVVLNCEGETFTVK